MYLVASYAQQSFRLGREATSAGERHPRRGTTLRNCIGTVDALIECARPVALEDQTLIRTTCSGAALRTQDSGCMFEAPLGFAA